MLKENKTFDVLVCCYGDYLDIAQRCLNSIINLSSQNLNIHVGLNECGYNTKNYCRNLLDNSNITTLIDSRINLNKDPMMRKLIDCVNNEYFLWLDDDSYISEKNWDLKVIEHINSNDFDISGFPHISHRLAWPYKDPSYYEYLRQRPWFRDNIKPDMSQCHFSIGACWIGRTQYLVDNNYPDKGMNQRWHQHRDDMLLGDMIIETGGRWRHMFGWDSTFKVNKADRRGL
jgi:hypothetical protein